MASCKRRKEVYRIARAGGQCSWEPAAYDGLAPPRLFPATFPWGPWADVPPPPSAPLMIQAPSSLALRIRPPIAYVLASPHMAPRITSLIIRYLVSRLFFFFTNLKCATTPPPGISPSLPLHEQGAWRQDMDQGHSWHIITCEALGS